LEECCRFSRFLDSAFVAGFWKAELCSSKESDRKKGRRNRNPPSRYVTATERVSEIDAPTRTADDFVAKGNVNAEMIKRKTVGNLFNSLILRLSLDSFSASPIKRIGAGRRITRFYTSRNA
jgi:hypothetical protein